MSFSVSRVNEAVVGTGTDERGLPVVSVGVVGLRMQARDRSGKRAGVRRDDGLMDLGAMKP